jgi:hypothetical protein
MQHTAFMENSTTIKSADEKATQIERQLEELDLPRSEVQDPIDGTTEPRGVPSSFRRRLTAARTSREG